MARDLLIAINMATSKSAILHSTAFETAESEKGFMTDRRIGAHRDIIKIHLDADTQWCVPEGLTVCAAPGWMFGEEIDSLKYFLATADELEQFETALDLRQQAIDAIEFTVTVN